MSKPAFEEVEHAALALKRGELVAFPTETVYGLGADAENVTAVQRIFAVKRRPANHPLIVHIAATSELERWARALPAAAERLAKAFWPGPLTLILAKSPRVPLETTGGLDSVGLRVPAHPLALSLLARFGGGLAAPSANRFGRVSPTSAEHVRAELGSDVDIVLDGGACGVGIESTIVDLTGEVPVLLRPGGVTAEQLELLLGEPLSRRASESTRAPGMLASHYAPRALVELCARTELAQRARELASVGQRVAILMLPDSRDALSRESLPASALVLDLGFDERDATRELYAALRRADAEGVDRILASPPVVSGLGEALADRLTKAAGPR